MGSKGKDKVSVDKNPTVSIVTITQLKRFPCIEILKDMIEAQTYTNIIEWVIVEGSPLEDDMNENKIKIQGLMEQCKLIKYIEKVPGEKLGALRNKGNKACTGDITVVMDDDDYYPVERVEEAVKKLQGSKFLLAGCSDMLIYDYTLEKLCQFKKFGEYHSVNSCMAWKKAFLDKHSHDPMKDTGEEPSFTNNFKEPMVQLDSKKTIVQSSHSFNTFNKRELLTAGITKVNNTVSEITEPVTNLIKEPFFTRMKGIFFKEATSKYDIVYFAGGFSINWDPRSTTLGGSEQAVVHLSSSWVKLGKKVAVYGVVPEITHEGVDYIDWKKFPFNETHDILILWRVYGLICGGPFNIKAKHIWLDFHDGTNPKEFYEPWYRYGSKATKIFFKSNYHKELFEKTLKTKVQKYAIIPNGVRIAEFSENKEMVQRNPYRFCYCSCYTRGLMQFLQYLWPVIKKMEPRAELHVYYGMDTVKNEEFLSTMRQLLATPGVMDHGRQPMDIIIREKHMSNFHLYISNSDAEIDCISVRESLVAGAIPLISNYGVFKEREGIHFDLEENQMSYLQVALKIINIMKDTELDSFREKLKKSTTLINWIDVSARWIQESF
jgi:glycosyltransferase involved in cell wall biosynthesis